MSINILSVGDKIELEKANYYKGDNSIDKKNYYSQLFDIIDHNRIKISMPIDKGRIIPLSINEKYILYIYTRKGLYKCESVVKGRYQEKKIHVLNMVLLSEFVKVQRREYFRLNYRFEIDFHIISDIEKNIYKKLQEDEIEDDKQRKKLYELLLELENEKHIGNVINISGGGICFMSKVSLSKNQLVKLYFELTTSGQRRKYVLQASVIQSEKSLDQKAVYKNRAKFIDIRKKDREDIIQFIFEEQRMQRKQEKRRM